MIGWNGARRPLRIGSRLTGSAALAGGATAVVLDVNANQIGALGQRVSWILTVLCTAGAVAMWALAHRAPPVPEIVERRSLTDRSPLVGRGDAIDETVHKARAHRCVLVRGPRGIGTSAVAIEAMLNLVPAPGERHWVDAHGQDEREVRLSVLRTLDLPVAHAGDGAADLISSRLRNSGEALLIDNVTDPGQVRWIARPISKAYVIIAGDLGPDDLRGVAEAAVGGLAPGEGLRLFCNPYGLTPASGSRRGRPWLRLPRLWHRPPPNTITERVAAEPGPAAELARSYLLRPRVVKETGRIFDANPGLSVSELLELLRPGAPSELSDRFRDVFRSLLAGVPKEGRRLLALMTLVPYAAYEVTALAALAGWPVARTDACLADLAARTLVHRGPGGVRLSEQAGTLGLDTGRLSRARARRRLYAYYAELAADHADRLGTERYPEARTWFASSDAVLKRLTREDEPTDEIVAIADALEVWYAQEGRAPEREAVARTLVELETEPAASVGHLRLAAMARTRGDADTAAGHLHRATALMPPRGLPQWYTEAALQSLYRDDLPAARDDIERCIAARPPVDTRGRIGDEINLGVVATREGEGAYGVEPSEPENHRAESLERAYRHFIQALDLAEDIGEISGQAHAHEMIGVVLARQQKTQAALREWQAAGELWARIGDEAGRRRCDHHRATPGQPRSTRP
jgi:tetratricopeptide (TPR) repeat protein